MLPKVANEYVRATNDHDAAAFVECFSEDAVVNDAGREFRGLDAIKTWSRHEIMDAKVTLDVLKTVDRGGEVIISTKVDGNFDRTGLPDPLIIDHHISIEHGKIARLRCSLADQESSP